MTDDRMENLRRLMEMEEQIYPTVRIEEERLQQAMVKQIAKKAQSSGTTQLEKDSKSDFPVLPSARSYGMSFERSGQLTVLPADINKRQNFGWVIEIQGLGKAQGPIGIEIRGDVVFGVSRTGESGPDFDLTPYGASENGVSRRHIMLRPSRKRLYLIDLESTNGTRVNAMPVTAGLAKDLGEADTISLGALTFTIKIISSPEQ